MKTNFFKSTVAILILGFVSYSIAQSTDRAKLPDSAPSRTSWTQEPTSFVGLSFIEPTKLENCPASKIDPIYPIHRPDYPEMLRRAKAQEDLGCVVEVFSKTTVPAKKPPVENVWGDGTGSGTFSVFSYRVVSPLRNFLRVHTQNGVVVSIEATFSTDDYAKMKAILTERYGGAQRKDVTEFQTNGGASFPSETLSWFGNKVSLEVRSLVERKLISSTLISSGVILITNNEWAKLNSEAEKSSIKSSAGKL
jgi:hypothetical protein